VTVALVLAFLTAAPSFPDDWQLVQPAPAPDVLIILDSLSHES
jgi:hypothetical protein